MKHITLTFCVLLFATSCFSQQKLASLEQGTIVKVKGQQYHIDKLKGGATIENLSNRFIGVEPTYPNLPYGINPGDLYKVDAEQLEEICGRYLSLIQLRELARLKENVLMNVLMVKLRLDEEGNILEVSFFTGSDSILTVKQLSEIEAAIKKEVNPTVVLQTKRYLKDTNYALMTRLVFFDSLLKAKEK